MTSTHSTPSVDFQFIDAPDTHPESPPPLEQSELNYELSATNSKKNAQFQSTSIAPQMTPNQLVTIKNSFIYDQLNQEQFFDDFEAHFTVTLNSSSTSLDHSNALNRTKKLRKEEDQPSQKENECGIFNRISLPNRPDLQKSNFPLLPSQEGNHAESRPNLKRGVHPIYCFKKKQQSKKQKQVLQHAQSQRATKKDVYLDSTQLPNLDQTCKHLRADFSLTLKAHEKKTNDPSKRYYDNIKKKKNLSMKMNDILKKSIEHNQTSLLTLQGRNKPVTVSKHLKKSNIFLRLPALC